MSSSRRFYRWLMRQFCKVLGHREARYTAFEPGKLFVAIGCERCDSVLSVDERYGDYPLPRY